MAGLLGITVTQGTEYSQLIRSTIHTTKKITVARAVGRVIKRGMVLGQVKVGEAAAEAVAGGTGDGTLTLDATNPILADVQPGLYKAVCTAAVADGGVFRIYDPKGNVLGDVAVGDTFASQVKFVIADGLADFVAGDAFEITVEAGSLKFAPLDLTALDGTAQAAAIAGLFEDVEVVDADQVVQTYFAGEYRLTDLVWPDGITAAQINAAVEQLDARGIIVE